MKIQFSKKEIAPLFVIFLMLVAVFVFYSSPCLPDQLPIHWNASGEIDDWANKNFVILFFPVLTLGLYLLLTFLPLVDPFRENYKKFVLPYFLIRLFLVLLFAFFYFYTLWATLGYAPKINFLIIPLFSLFVVILGFIMPKLKRNFFVGIRSPWTLQSDVVWDKTHQFAKKTMMATGILCFFTMLLGDYGFVVFTILILFGALSPVFYSYFIYKKLKLFNK